MFLIPQYNFGTTLLTASLDATGDLTKSSLSDEIINTLLPTLGEIAKDQAHTKFSGHFTSTSSNTSVTVTTDGAPGLKVTQYISDSINFLDTVFALFGEDIDFRLVPNFLYGGNKIGFTAVYQPPEKVSTNETWYDACPSWLDIDDFTFASVPLGQFVFEIDESGKAGSVEIKALGTTLARKSM